MQAVTIHERRLAARINLVDEHVRAENEHELDGTMATMNETPLFKLNNDEVSGRDGVRAFYADLFQGFPDFHIDVTQRHVSDEAVILEVIISGTHTNEWRGIPASGRPIEVPLCVVFPFDESDRITGERAYFDGALWLRQLGVLPPQ
jgi:steroid delta-isomerase-like uncharacterized protein